MKKFTRRSLAWLTSLMLFVSLFAAVIALPVQAATVNYVYADNYVYNWGERDELATFLSPMAEDFYGENNVTYTQLASLSGSSTTSSVPYSSLFLELHELMYSNLDNPTSYDATRSLFKYTDCENSGGSISSFYSAKAIGPSWDSGKTWNREHVWPNSKSNGGSNSNTQRETDIMMLRPASVSENSSRSNTAYGEGSKFYDPNELGQNVRGDAARIVLYVYVCWGGSSSHDGALDYMWGSSGVIESKDILLKWMEEDPVDTWELGRNDSVESITGTRNVFVDYPELAFLLFDEDVPAGYDSPSGEGTTSGYTVTASTNNSNYGTVSVSGNVITASPKTGYEATGYTILSGTATVTRTGNKFVVSPSSDVSVRINFGKRELLTVQFVQAGGALSTQTAYAGDPITLPAHSGSVPAGQTFLGWCSYEVSETTAEPTYYAAGATWYVNAGVTLYALYARSEEGGVVNNNTYEPYSGALTEGDYLIIYQDGALKAEMGTNDRLSYAEVSTASGSIKDPAASIVWKIAKNGSNWTLYNVAAGVYAGGNGTKNKGALLTEITDFAKWTATGDGTYEFVNVGNKAKSVNANLRRNGTYGFACYSTTTGGALTLYKRASGTLYYFTATQVVCDTHTYDNACDATCNVCGTTRVPAAHVYTSRVTTAATCAKAGVRTYTCSVCGDSYTEVIAATGNHTYDNACDADCNVCGAVRVPADHDYVGVVTEPECYEPGYTTYTCSVCGDSYVGNETDPAHSEVIHVDAKTPTCTEPGNIEYEYCADCGQVWVEGGFYPNVMPIKLDASCKYGAVHVAAKEATCTEEGNLEYWYCANCDVYYADADCTVVTNRLNIVIPVSHNIVYVPAKTPTCTEWGNIEYWCCEDCGRVWLDSSGAVPTNMQAVKLPMAGHTYDNGYDTDCNVCGEVRQAAALVLSGGLTSVSEDVNGLAFSFDAAVSGAQVVDRYTYVGGSATVTPVVGGESYAVVRMGAVVTNQGIDAPSLEDVDGVGTIDIEAKYLYRCKAESVSYAIRVIDIPDNGKDTVVTARPYYVYEVDGEEVVVYGTAVSATYNEAAK